MEAMHGETSSLSLPLADGLEARPWPMPQLKTLHCHSLDRLPSSWSWVSVLILSMTEKVDRTEEIEDSQYIQPV